MKIDLDCLSKLNDDNKFTNKYVTFTAKPCFPILPTSELYVDYCYYFNLNKMNEKCSPMSHAEPPIFSPMNYLITNE